MLRAAQLIVHNTPEIVISEPISILASGLEHDITIALRKALCKSRDPYAIQCAAIPIATSHARAAAPLAAARKWTSYCAYETPRARDHALRGDRGASPASGPSDDEVS